MSSCRNRAHYRHDFAGDDCERYVCDHRILHRIVVLELLDRKHFQGITPLNGRATAAAPRIGDPEAITDEADRQKSSCL